MARRVAECEVPTCERSEVLRRGMCFRHYQRWRTYGDPLAPQVAERNYGKRPTPPRLTDAERIAREKARNERSGRARRAKKAGVYREAYTRAEIAERDDYVCGLCGLPVDMSLKWPHPESASVDHIIPLSMGGADAPSNVRLAHVGENISRGARPNWQISVAG